MKTYLEKLPGLLAFIESGNGIAKKKAKKELEEMAKKADAMKTKISHKKRHIELYKALDELFADYIKHHPDKIKFAKMPLIDLIDWSFEQTKNPNEGKN